MPRTKTLLFISAALNAALVALIIVLWFAGSAPSERPSTVKSVQVRVLTRDYGEFTLRVLGDSYCGTVSESPEIQFDCGPLAGVYAASAKGETDRRWLVGRTPRTVAASLLAPPAISRLPGNDETLSIKRYYPINVFSRDQDVLQHELLALAFDIEAAILAAHLEAIPRVQTGAASR